MSTGAEDQAEFSGELPDADMPHASRISNCLLGGKDNYKVDRDIVAENLEEIPDAPDRMRAQRLFVERATRYLVGEAGIRQILDVGAGLPQQVMPDVHEIALHLAPDCRLVYADISIVAVAHLRANYAKYAKYVNRGQIAAVAGRLQEPEMIVDAPDTQRVLTFDEPVGVLLSGILHFIPDEDDPAGLVSRLRQRLAPGSFLAITHVSPDVEQDTSDKLKRIFSKPKTATPMRPRRRAQIEDMISGLELIEPGLVPVSDWRPDESSRNLATSTFGAVALLR